MTTLTKKKITLRAASLGDVNLMPDLLDTSYIHAKCDTTKNLTDEDKIYFGKGKINTLLPYLSQDGDDRDIKDREFTALILENERIRAIFLPELGGRLWSLYHKELSRELLYVNDVVQPGNLALRNAWVAGGVEFNANIKGHSPFTCSTVFATKSKNDNGEPILSIYEYERIRGTVWAINAYIPNGDDKLYIRTTIENKTDGTPYTYWWSNIAVPEGGVRVYTDADEMFTCTYEDNHYVIDKVKVPYFNGADMSRPETARHAGDVFYVTAPGRKWIASPECDGIGLLQYSTPELIGRKTFFWGQGRGGRNWNRHLCASDRAYIEIQAGLRYMQMEHLPMRPYETISFTECYTALNIDKEISHGERERAIAHISGIVNSMPDPKDADIPLNREKSILVMGSGFGALEERKISDFYPFPKESLGDEESEWLKLRDDGHLPTHEYDYYPKSYMTDKKTLDRLVESTKSDNGNHWYTYLHIGIAKYTLGDTEGAMEAFKTSVSLKDNSAARRNIAMLEKNIYGNLSSAVDNILRAFELRRVPDRGITTDLAKTLTASGNDEKWLEIFDKLPKELKDRARLQLYSAIALVNLGRREEAKKYINEDFEMPDVKEGELSVSAVWASVYGDEKPLPDKLNFKMFEI